MVQFSKAMEEISKTAPRPDLSPQNNDIKRESPPIDQETINAIPPQRIYNALLNYMQQVGSSVIQDNRFDFKRSKKIINLILNSPKSTWDDLQALTHYSSEKKRVDAFAAHAVDIAINALLIGADLGYDRNQLDELMTAALFHELGMYKLPEEIRKKDGSLTTEEYDQVRSHPFISHDILKSYDGSGNAADIVLQEHERMDGSGYPRKLQGDQIHDAAFIIGVLDIYGALIKNRPYRKRLSPADAIKEIVRRSKGLFPIRMIKHVMKLLSIYPVRTHVKLNNNALGVVVKTNPMWPLKPSVTILYDAQGTDVTNHNKIIDLSETPLLYIREAVSEASTSRSNRP